MPRFIPALFVFGFLGLCLAASERLAGAQGANRAEYPPLFFREDWKFDKTAPNVNDEREPEHVPVAGDLTNPNLELRIYGDKAGMRTVLQPYNNDIVYMMSLLTTSNWAVTLRDKNNDVDLSGLATMRWSTRQAGFHLLRPILKLANGKWLMGDKTSALTTDFVETEFNLADVRWRELDITNIVGGREAKWLDNPDLSRVEEVGFTDLMRGAGHGSGGGSRINWIQVTGKPILRATAPPVTPAAPTTAPGRGGRGRQ